MIPGSDIFIIEEIKGLKWPIERNNGMEEIELVGHMTIHGETKPLNWDVKLSFSDDNTASIFSSWFKLKFVKLNYTMSYEDGLYLNYRK